MAALWILVRAISWYSPAVFVRYPADPVESLPMHLAVKPQGAERTTMPLNVARDRASRYRTRRQYQTVDMPARSQGRIAVRKGGATGVSRPISVLWPYSDEGPGFFLPASLSRADRDSGIDAATIPRFPNPPAAPHSKNWAAYFWIHARQHSGPERQFHGTQGSTIANGQYGGSQAGAILSWRLFDRPVPETSLYARLSAALAPVSQEEIALGARLRPLRNIPLAVHAEQRFDAGSGRVAGTAFYATGGTGPDLVLERFALETYGQAGYVLGRNRTYFFDGFATVQRPIADLGDPKLSVGAGLWTGGQRDIRRLDIGPRASLDLPIGDLSTRIAVDGRVRVAGNARPGSGVALTVSTSF